MRQARQARWVLSLCLSAALWASAAPVRAQPGSQFIADMPADMQPGAGSPGSLRWISPKANLASYGKVMLEPLTFYVSPDSREKGLDADALKSLSDAFRGILIGQLKPNYPVVDKPGPGVLVLRPALTNVMLEKKRRGLLGYTPVGLLVNAARDEHAKNFSLKKAALEAELLDGASGERVAIVIDQAPEKAADQAAEAMDWSALEKTLAYYAQNLARRLDAARGK